MSDLYFSLRQRNVLILLTSNPPPRFLIFFYPHPFFFFPPLTIFCFNLYCLMDSTFVIMLAVPSKTDFCKISTLYDITHVFKLHSKTFGMDPRGPIIIGTINVYLPYILVISNCSSE